MGGVVLPLVLSAALDLGGMACAGEPRSGMDPDAARTSRMEAGFESDGLTGEGGGVRRQWVERGFHFTAGYTGEALAVVHGGRQGGTSYNGVLQVALELDLGRITRAGWTGATFHSSALWLSGDGLHHRVGDALGLSNIEGYDGVRLYELWLEQRAFADRVSLRVGQQVVDGEFGTSAYSGLFHHSDFGWPVFIAANTHNNGPAYPVGVLGALLKLEPGPAGYAQFAVFDGDSFDNPAGDPAVNAHGTHFRLSGAQGALAVAEAGWRWQPEAAAGGHPGTLKLGAWHHTASFADHQPSFSHAGNHGLYVVAEQLIWRESTAAAGNPQGLGAFVRGGFSPGDRSRFGWVVDAGLNYRGLLPGRDDDTVGLGLIHARASDELRRAQQAAGLAPQEDHETVIELAYRAQLRPWWSLEPNLQIVLHPGASTATPDALVLGLRTSLTF